jgi:hypothetical protein
MYAVIGSWDVEPGSLDAAQLDHIAAVVRQHPGFLRGYWGLDTDSAAVAQAIVLLDSSEQAQMFAAGIRSNIAGARLTVVEVLTEA